MRINTSVIIPIGKDIHVRVDDRRGRIRFTKMTDNTICIDIYEFRFGDLTHVRSIYIDEDVDTED